MKRSEALAEIRHCGYCGDTGKAAIIQTEKNIGAAAGRKAFIDGQKMRKRGGPCGGPVCSKIISNGREIMKGKFYRASAAVKDFGERSKLGFVAGFGKFLREIAMRITTAG
jgi:hypothetical protein